MEARTAGRVHSAKGSSRRDVPSIGPPSRYFGLDSDTPEPPTLSYGTLEGNVACSSFFFFFFCCCSSNKLG